jgi:glutamyl-tRNA reductase
MGRIMDIVCIGLNHETAPVEVRERLALKGDSLQEALRWLKRQPAIQETVVLATCNRVEIYLVTEQGSGQVEPIIRNYLTDRCGIEEADWERLHYRHGYHKAITHLFRVASGMDSMVIGEPQITGQVKDAYREAVHQKAVGTILNRLFHRSFHVSKRVRTETELAARAVSVSYVAVELARKIFGDLSDRLVLLAGAGEMAELAARHLAANGIGRIFVASRTLENARRLAAAFQGEAIELDGIAACLDRVDILLCSTAAPGYILRADQVREAMRTRRNKPLFLIDIAVPRNIDPEVNTIENVYLYDIDDLQKVLQANLAERKKELTRAESIVQEEVRSFLAWMDGLDLVPTIVSLRQRAEEIRAGELKKALSVLETPLSDRDRQAIEAMSQAIVNKILHGPVSTLKKAEEKGEPPGLAEAARRLFSLGPGKG